MLGDVDRQQSSRQWLELRPRELPRDPATGNLARRHAAPAEGHDPRRARHARRPARQAARRGDASSPTRCWCRCSRACSTSRPRTTSCASCSRTRARRQDADRRRGHARRAKARSPADQLRQFLAEAALPVRRQAARHAELRAPGRARPHAVGRGAEPRRARRRAVATDHRGGSNCMKVFEHLTEPAAARRPGDRRKRLDHRRSGAHRPVRRCDRRPPMDPRRPERAAQAGPFGTTVAHGFLTLSLMPRAVRAALRRARHAHGRQLRAQQGALPGAGAGGQPLARRASSCSATSRSTAARS